MAIAKMLIHAYTIPVRLSICLVTKRGWERRSHDFLPISNMNQRESEEEFGLCLDPAGLLGAEQDFGGFFSRAAGAVG